METNENQHEQTTPAPAGNGENIQPIKPTEQTTPAPAASVEMMNSECYVRNESGLRAICDGARYDVRIHKERGVNIVRELPKSIFDSACGMGWIEPRQTGSYVITQVVDLENLITGAEKVAGDQSTEFIVHVGRKRMIFSKSDILKPSRWAAELMGTCGIALELMESETEKDDKGSMFMNMVARVVGHALEPVPYSYQTDEEERVEDLIFALREFELVSYSEIFQISSARTFVPYGTKLPRMAALTYDVVLIPGDSIQKVAEMVGLPSNRRKLAYLLREYTVGSTIQVYDDAGTRMPRVWQMSPSIWEVPVSDKEGDDEDSDESTAPIIIESSTVTTIESDVIDAEFEAQQEEIQERAAQGRITGSRTGLAERKRQEIGEMRRKLAKDEAQLLQCEGVEQDA